LVALEHSPPPDFVFVPFAALLGVVGSLVSTDVTSFLPPVNFFLVASSSALAGLPVIVPLEYLSKLSL